LGQPISPIFKAQEIGNMYTYKYNTLVGKTEAKSRFPLQRPFG